MFNYLFPIFCFGLVITGIVFLGVQRAFDLAAQKSEMEPVFERPGVHLPGRGSAPIKPLATVSRR